MQRLNPFILITPYFLRFGIGMLIFHGLSGLGKVSGQTPYYLFENLSEIQPLPDSRRVFQDRDGFIWLGSHDGLWKFNGYSFEHFKASGDDQELSNYVITAIAEDAKGRLWVACVGDGIDISDRYKKQFTNIKNYVPFVPRRVDAIFQDKNGTIWVGSRDGLFLIKETANLQFKMVEEHPVLDLQRSVGTIVCNDFVQDDLARIWIASSRGLLCFDPEEREIIFPGNIKDLDGIPITDLEVQESKSLWLSTLNSEYPFWYSDLVSPQFTVYQPIKVVDPTTPVYFCLDKLGALWYSSFGSGFLVFDLEKEQVKIESRKNSNLSYARFLRAPYPDNIGNVYIPGDGLFKWPHDRGFRNYLHPYGAPQSISAVFKDQNWFLAGYRELGLVSEESNSGIQTLISLESAEMVNPITNIAKTQSGFYLVVGIDGFHVLDKDLTSVHFEYLPGSNRYVLEDSDQNIWIAGQSSLVQFNLSNYQLRQHRPKELKGADPYFQTIVEAEEKSLWIASDGNGLFHFDSRKETFTQHGKDHGLPSLRINDLAKDSIGQLWIGTDVGLVKRTSSAEFFLFNGNHGLYNDYVASVIITSNEDIWISTNNGISFFDSKLNRFKNYDSTDGLANALYYPRVRFQFGDQLYFGGRNGLDFFSKSELSHVHYRPKVLIDKIDLGEETNLYYPDLNKDSEIQISADIEFLRISYVGLDFPSSRRIVYDYRIPGISDEWIQMGEKREVFLTKLPAGKYNFEVRAVDRFETEIDASTLIQLKVLAPWYLRWPFLLFFSSLLTVTIVHLIRRRDKILENKRHLQKEMDDRIHELEKKALLSQMNPHFIFNAINSIQEFILIGDKENALTYLSKFSRLVRNVLNYSSQKTISLADELTFIEDYLELQRLRFPDKFAYQIIIGNEVDIHTTEIPPFIVQPQIENAILHGFSTKKDAGNLLLKFWKIEDKLMIVIEDDGVGRKHQKFQNSPVQKSNGLGLSIVKERIELLKQTSTPGKWYIEDLKNPDGTAAGTKVTIELTLE